MVGIEIEISTYLQRKQVLVWKAPEVGIQFFPNLNDMIKHRRDKETKKIRAYMESPRVGPNFIQILPT